MTSGVGVSTERQQRSRISAIAAASVLCSGAALVGYLGLVVVPASLHPNTNGFAAYYTTSKILITHRQDVARVYDNRWFQRQVSDAGFANVAEIHNTQPPTVSLMMAPLAWMSPARARICWVACSVFLWLGSLALLARSAPLIDCRGPIVRQGPVLPLMVLAGATTAYVPLSDNLHQGQCYALLLMFVCVWWYLMARPASNRDWLAGIPLGLMLVMKLAGVWLWPLLLVSGRRKVLLGAAATAVCVAACSLPFIGWAPWLAFAHGLPRLASDPVRYVTAYQTVTSLTGHLFVFDARWNPHPAIPIRGVGAGIALATGAAALVASALLQRLDSDRLEDRLLSLALLVSLLVSLSPVAESYHYLLVLPALVTAFWWALSQRANPSSWSVLAVAAALLVVPSRLYTTDILTRGWMALMAYPRLYGAFVVWGWVAFNLRRHSRLDRPVPA